ncbi:MAG: hypothetical protein QXH67_00455 [Candidatus Bathyarchaeia archaeon]
MVFRNEDVGGIVLPISDNHLVQGVTYSDISEDLSILYEKGFIFESRKFKHFIFSKIQDHYTLDKYNEKNHLYW